MKTKIKPIGHVREKRLLAARGWTTRAAAPQLGVCPSHLSAVLNGHRESRSLLARVRELPDRKQEVAR